MATRNRSARWNGDLASGSGRMPVGPARVDRRLLAASRFEDGAGTNPEELIAAAHAGCFAMALCHVLTEAGQTPRSIETVAQVPRRPADDLEIDLETPWRLDGLSERERDAPAPMPERRSNKILSVSRAQQRFRDIGQPPVEPRGPHEAQIDSLTSRGRTGCQRLSRIAGSSGRAMGRSSWVDVSRRRRQSGGRGVGLGRR
jgi:osmotically inducible protein OsmC